MPDSIDDLAQRWRAQPDEARTLTLCGALGRVPLASRQGLLDEVRQVVADRHGASGLIVLSLARLYVDDNRLVDAQRILTQAMRVLSQDHAILRLTGEVLLRRGEAIQAEAMLQRAMQRGATDPETAALLDQASRLVSLQQNAGPQAVAVEVKGTLAIPVAPEPATAVDHDAAAWREILYADEATEVRAPPALSDPKLVGEHTTLPGPVRPIVLPTSLVTEPLAWKPTAIVVPPFVFPSQQRNPSDGATLVVPVDVGAAAAFSPGPPGVVSAPVAAPEALARVPAAQPAPTFGAQQTFSSGPAAGPMVPNPPPNLIAPKPRRVGLIIGIVILVLVLLGAAAVAVYFLVPTASPHPTKHSRH